MHQTYLLAGGTEEEFEKALPDLKTQELARLTLEGAKRARQASNDYYESSF